MYTQITPLAIWSDQEIWTWLGIDDERQENMKLQLKIDEKSKENAQDARKLLLVEKQLLRIHKKKEKIDKDLRLCGVEKNEKGKR